MKVILLPEIYDHTFKYKFRRGQKSMGNKLIKKKKNTVKEILLQLNKI